MARAERRRRETVVQTRGLSMRFGGVVANADVDFSLEAGELRCLIGPNGAGKSTFFKCLTGQLKPSSGAVEIRGVDMTGADPHEVAQMGVGVKMQTPSVFDGLSVRENVWLAARAAHGQDRADRLTAETLERVRLGDIRHAGVGALGHGQRQWVELAMVMAAEPWLVLLDEPAAGLTDEETVFTAELIREINRTASLIVVEHDMNFIRAIAGRVTVFHRGAILMEGTMDEVSADATVRDVYLGHKH
jgi:branched-chain amino acid transport system ATP-binding protein/urea transport system ATP-binding protein